MKRPIDFFLFRLKNEWSYHYKVWKTAVDWIVWLYILIPILVFFSFQYVLIWQGQANWLQSYPTELTWFFFFFLSTLGTVRLFLHEGDLLFVRQNKHWLYAMMRLGMIYSFCFNFFVILIAAMLLLPVWFVYDGASLYEIMIFICFIYFFRLSHQMFRQFLSIKFQHWKFVLINFGFFFLSFLVFLTYLNVSSHIQIIMTIIIIILTLFLCKKRLQTTWSFYEDCIRETHERLKLATLFIAASGLKVEKGKSKRKKPRLLFANSAPIFQKRTKTNIIAEAFIKFFIRSKTRLMLVIQVTVVCIVALVFVPGWLKWVLFLFSCFCINHLVRSSWKELKTHSFYQLLSIKDDEHLIPAVKHGAFLMTSPILFLFGFFTGWSAISPLVGLGIGIIIVILNYFDTKKAVWFS